MPHDDGRKSRCRLVTMMTKRSSHMPTLTMSDDDEQQTGDVAATLRNQSICGVRTLQKISAQ